MRSRLQTGFMLVLPMAVLAASVAFSAQMVSTTARGLNAVMQAEGFMIQPAGTSPAAFDDLAPQQLFELVRPGRQPVTIGRMFTSCTCIRLETDSRSFGPGEKAVLRLRNTLPTPPGGQTYAIYVQITSPITATLRYDTYVQSAQFVPAPEGFQPTRGNIVSDGVLIGGVSAPEGSDSAGFVTASATAYADANIEMIVPKAENYVPDTSEYTLRKKAEAGKAEGLKDESSSGKDTAKSGVPSGVDGDGEDELAAGGKPKMDEETRAAVDAALDKVEANMAKAGGVGEASAQMTVRDVADKARSEAEVAAKLGGGEAEGSERKAGVVAAKRTDSLWKEVGPKIRVVGVKGGDGGKAEADAAKAAAGE